ncbi:MAG: hypothetical protein KKF56_00925 [Nanoarchaeota archaeon]|nr:hypothetical protein [Nanoarchaeota archaeon]
MSSERINLRFEFNGIGLSSVDLRILGKLPKDRLYNILCFNNAGGEQKGFGYNPGSLARIAIQYAQRFAHIGGDVEITER